MICFRLLAPLLAACFASSVWAAAISDGQALEAGRRLWKNECGGTVAGLTSWNKGEEFPSLGIGHFIWYPAGARGPFEESFPSLIQFLAEQRVALPAWLQDAKACPWPSREAFLAEIGGPRLVELRALLARTVAEQARFAATRLERALPAMLEELPPGARGSVRRRFERIMAAPGGVYALVDYVNFKGEGTKLTERYAGQGWGLLQVLLEIRDEDAPTVAFAESAARVLARRVRNSPPERHEARWLPGWTARVRTYAPR